MSTSLKTEIVSNIHLQTIMLVDDDGLVNELNELTIRDTSFCDEVIAFTNVEDAMSFLNDTAKLPEVVIMDARLPTEMESSEFIDYVKINFPSIEIVLLSAYINEESIKRFKAKGCREVFIKPLTEEKLEDLLKKKSHN